MIATPAPPEPLFNFDRILAIIFGLISVVSLAYAVYSRSKRAEKARIPTFSIQQPRDILIRKIILEFPDFTASHGEISLAGQDVIGMRFRFWNSSSLPILAGDMLTPFRATFPIDCKILNTSIPVVSRSEVKATIQTDKVSGADSILITVAVLDLH